MGLLDTLLGHAGEKDIADLHEEFGPLLAQGEALQRAFGFVRDLMALSGLEKQAKKSASDNGGQRRGQGQGQGGGKAQSKPRQPDPLQTALGFAGMAQPRRHNRGGGSHAHAGHALPGMPRRRPRG